jgi:hypothetical protein
MEHCNITSINLQQAEELGKKISSELLKYSTYKTYSRKKSRKKLLMHNKQDLNDVINISIEPHFAIFIVVINFQMSQI